MTVAPTSQPAELDAQQLTGQLVAGVQAVVRTELEAHAEVYGYRSEFGIGAAACILVALVLTLWLGHRREMARIKQNGRH